MSFSEWRASRAVSVVAAASLALGITACGSDDNAASTGGSSSSANKECIEAFDGCVDEKNPVVKEALDRFNAYAGSHDPEAWPGPTTAPEVPKDKSLVLIPCSGTTPGCTTQTDGAAEAAKLLGWKTLTIDGRGDPKVYDQAIRTAINRKADGVMLSAIADQLAAPAIAAARKAGLAVVSYGTENVAKPDGVNWEQQIHYDTGGQATGDWLIAYTNGKGKFVIVNDPEFPSITKFLAGVRDTITSKCPDCEILDEMDMAVADFGTTLLPRSVALLQKNPTTQIVVGPYDPAVSAMQGAARQAGITKVKWVGSNGDPSAIEQIKGDGPQVITLGQPFVWGGWAAVDTFVRLFAGEEPVDEKFPNRVMTIWDADSLPDKGYWDGGLDFRAEYKKIWKK